MTTDRAYMRRTLAALSDAELFERTLELLRLARFDKDEEGGFTDLDRVWTMLAWYEWCERDKAEQYAEAVRQAARTTSS